MVLTTNKKINFQVSAVLLLCVSSCAGADQICLQGDFDSQVQFLLDYEFLKPEQIQNLNRVVDDVKRTFEQEWKELKIYLFGSLVNGLASKLSDVDIIVKVQNSSDSMELNLRDQAVAMIRRQPELYSQVSMRLSGRGIPLIDLYHIPTQTQCDITFRSQSSFENSQLLGYYFKLDQRNLALASLIKFWSKIHRTSKPGIFQSYAIYLLVVLYLQEKELVPPASLLEINLSKNSNVWDDRNPKFIEIPYNTSNTESLYQLLGGFFKYYSELNLKDNVLLPLVGKVIPRNVFLSNNSIPEEYAEIKSYLTKVKSEPIELGTAICLLDIFEQSTNIADNTAPEQAAEFVYHVKFAARVFEEVPSDHFLTAILTKDKYDKFPNEIDEIRPVEDCINVTSQTMK